MSKRVARCILISLLLALFSLSVFSFGKMLEAAGPTVVTVAAEPQTKVKGDPDPPLTYISSDSNVRFTGVLAREPGESEGSYKINIGTLAAVGNYTIDFIPAELAIIPRAQAAGDPGLITNNGSNGAATIAEIDPESAPSHVSEVNGLTVINGSNSPQSTYTLISIVLLGVLAIGMVYYILRRIYLAR
jgi:hypothetical protein